MSNEQIDYESNELTNVFSDSTFPLMVLNKIWSYLIDEAPLEDAIVLTCKAFRDLTYNHPSHAMRFHFRLEPQFTLNNAETNINHFQIGSSTSGATKRAIVVKSINDAITNNPNRSFPFHSLKVFMLTQSLTAKDVIPFFAQFQKSIKFLSINCCKFLNEDLSKKDKKSDDEKKEDIIPSFPSCMLLSLLTRRRWHKSVNLNGKFPNLLCFLYTIEWYSHFDLIQDFLDSHSKSIVILFLDFNFNVTKKDKDEWDANGHKLRLKLPPNVEICVLSCKNAESAKYIELDFSDCRHNLKMINCLMNALKMCNSMFCDGFGNKKLEFLVVNSKDDTHFIKWDALQLGSEKMNKLKQIHLPYTPQFAKGISEKCVGAFPDLESVKECVASVGARQVLRDLICESRRHWLWGIFWHERHGIGLKNLKKLEDKWNKEKYADYV